MHGNVWEWCADHWHDNYEGSPQDGRAWFDENANKEIPRLLRGGSWFSGPRYCRSACRDGYLLGRRLSGVGFRVCCLPQD
jgi:formylglycine-generating enzyme required for sulfatase activity